MKHVDYKKWGKYLSNIYLDFFKTKGTVLELGAGTCRLSQFLKNISTELYCSDLSLNMLLSNEQDINKICCNMTELPFKTKFDFVFSAFDSVNYLLTEKELLNLFSEVKKLLTKNSVFTFDVSLINNSYNNVKHLNRKGKYKGIEYKQESEFDEYSMIHINRIEMITPEGVKITEIHQEKVYPFFLYFDLLDTAGFKVVKCFECFTFRPASEDNERVQFVTKLKSNAKY